MSSLKDTVPIPITMIPKILENKITLIANVQITQDEINLFQAALNAISEQLEEDGIEESKLTRVNALFTKDGSFHFVDEGENVALGLHFSLSLFAMDRIRVEVKKKNEIIYLIVFIEELVHHYWSLEDEVETKVKLIEILNRILEKPVGITDVFPKDWLNEELARQGKQPRY